MYTEKICEYFKSIFLLFPSAVFASFPFSFIFLLPLSFCSLNPIYYYFSFHLQQYNTEPFFTAYIFSILLQISALRSEIFPFSALRNPLECASFKAEPELDIIQHGSHTIELWAGNFQWFWFIRAWHGIIVFQFIIFWIELSQAHKFSFPFSPSGEEKLVRPLHITEA